MMENLKNLTLITGAVLCFGMLLRSSVSVHSYSGEGKPPMYGDYEAQRHWQEITLNLPIKEWYSNSTQNDLMYWGLDYPPLTAYHSYLVALVARGINSSYVGLATSRGIESEGHKDFMRSSVLVADYMIYIPSLLLFVYYCSPHSVGPKILDQLIHLVVMLSYPGQILIDNGHFQYNNISLGFAVIATTLLFLRRNLLCSVAFCFALNYKQMELYHALPFFFALLNRSFVGKRSFLSGVKSVVMIGLVVIATFALIWLPWLSSWQSTKDVIHRVFPIARGVFEDKVSNVWCVLNVIIKWKQIFSNVPMAILCISTTLTVALSSCINLMVEYSNMKFLYCLVNTSLSFFLFSFQVHEKSILLVAMGTLLLFPIEPFMCLWFLQISTFSMIPLLSKDNLTIAYFALNIVFNFLMALMTFLCYGPSRYRYDFLQIETLAKRLIPKRVKREVWTKYFCIIYYSSLLLSQILVLCHLCITPPTKLPDIFTLLISAYSCAHFLLFLLYFNVRQFNLSEI